MKSIIATAVFVAAIGVVAPANAVVPISVPLVDKIVITSAVPDYLQVGELLAFEAGTGKDVALGTNGGFATAVSVWSAGAGPDKAIDGLYPAGFLDPSYNPSYPGPYGIYHSAGNGPGESLTVTFNPTDLGSIEIYGRTDCCNSRDIYNVAIYSADRLLRTDTVNATGGFAFAPVPEPATWALFFLGFGAIGWMMRGERRKETVVVA